MKVMVIMMMVMWYDNNDGDGNDEGDGKDDIIDADAGNNDGDVMMTIAVII